MRWLKRDVWKAGIALAGLLFLLVLIVWVPVSVAGADGGALGLPTPVTVQATPTVDATVTALNKEKLVQEVDQLKNQQPRFGPKCPLFDFRLTRPESAVAEARVETPGTHRVLWDVAVVNGRVPRPPWLTV